MTRDEALAMDAADPLAPLRQQFQIPDGLIYLDGNSLGVLPRATAARVAQVVTEEWGQGLIGSWNSAGWMALPERIGAKIAPLLGVAPAEVVVADSTSVNLFKVLAAALDLQRQDAPQRTVIVSERSNFPTDLYIAESLGRQHGCRLHLVDAPEDIPAALGPDTAVLMLTQVNYRTGRLHDMAALSAAAHAAGALAVAVCDPVALALLEPPGRQGADVVVGEAQCLGSPMSFGGPLLGYFAARRGLLRALPGRLVAETVDRDGRRGFVLTLQTREQHIRREKATSNICSNEGLLALRATIHLGLLGRDGMREVAELCVQKSHHAARLGAAIPGYSLAFAAPFFREFVLRCPVEARRVIEAGVEAGIRPGINLGRFRPAWKDLLLVTVTELRSAPEIERWAQTLRRAGGAR